MNERANRSRLGSACLAAFMLGFAFPASAQVMPDRYNVWDLRLGIQITDIPDDAFVNLACGTNGGPPSKPVAALGDFADCPPEPQCLPDGQRLYEIYVEYDDQIYYWARAHDFELVAARFAGTKILTHPIILSLIWSEPGVLQGIRVVTDPHAGVEERMAAYKLGHQMKGRYGLEGWDCTQLPREERETPMAGIFVKEQCTRPHDEGRIFIDSRFLKKPGQTSFNPRTQQVVVGEFESSGRLEILNPLIQTRCD